MNIFAAVPTIELEEIITVLTLLSIIVGALLWINSRQDELIQRFNEIDSRHFRLRARLALSFERLGNQLAGLESRISDLESFETKHGYHKRQSPPRESKGIELWNETSLEDETKIPD